MKTVQDVRQQLRSLCQQLGVALCSSGDPTTILRALLTGLFTNTAEHIGEGRYHTVSPLNQNFVITVTHTHTQFLLYSWPHDRKYTYTPVPVYSMCGPTQSVSCTQNWSIPPSAT